jgi:DNA end-binding protein Ku
MVWKFQISFGLVNIPVRLHPTAKEDRIGFNMLSPSGHRVRQKLVDEVTGEEVDRAKVKKGYEISKGKYLVFEKEEIEGLRLKTTKTIEILGFLPASFEQHPMYRLFQKEHFYLAPEKSEKAYTILYEALRELGVAAVGKVVLPGSGKESTVVITPFGKMLLLTVLYYKHEIQSPPQVDLAQVDEREKELGKQLLQALGTPDVEKLKDRYIEAVRKLIEAKAKGRPVEAGEVEVKATEESDIAAALERSLGLAKKKLGVAVASPGDEQAQEV